MTVLARRLWGLSFLLLGGAALPAPAADDLHTEVTHANGRYHVDFGVRLEAPIERVRRHLTDYDHLDRLSDTIVESKILSRNEEQERVMIALRPCALIFCRTIRRTVDVQYLPDGNILSLADPDNSDFSFSLERWQLESEDDGKYTRLRYTAEFEPSFFLPPLIGPWLVKSSIRDELETTAERLEALARE